MQRLVQCHLEWFQKLNLSGGVLPSCLKHLRVFALWDMLEKGRELIIKIMEKHSGWCSLFSFKTLTQQQCLYRPRSSVALVAFFRLSFWTFDSVSINTHSITCRDTHPFGPDVWSITNFYCLHDAQIMAWEISTEVEVSFYCIERETLEFRARAVETLFVLVPWSLDLFKALRSSWLISAKRFRSVELKSSSVLFCSVFVWCLVLNLITIILQRK